MNFAPDAADRLPAAVRDFWAALPAPPRLVLALVSGGPDSMALLDLLERLRGELGFELRAGHLNYGLRPEADAETDLVEAWCRDKQVPLAVKRIELPGVAGRQARARQARWEFAREQLAEATGAAAATMKLPVSVAALAHPWAAVALGHQAEDQVETVILHLLRGTGLAGLGGMSPVATVHGLTLLRPLLTVSRARILAYLAARSVPYRLDGSNDTDDYQRNLVRHTFHAMAAKINPAYREHFLHAAEQARASHRLLQASAAARVAAGVRYCGYGGEGGGKPLAADAASPSPQPSPARGEGGIGGAASPSPRPCRQGWRPAALTGMAESAASPARGEGEIGGAASPAREGEPGYIYIDRSLLKKYDGVECYYWWQEAAGRLGAGSGLTAARFRELEQFLAGPALYWSGWSDLAAEKFRETIYVFRRRAWMPPPEATVTLHGRELLRGWGLTLVTERTSARPEAVPAGAAVLAAAALRGPWVVRARRAGDRFRPAGLGGHSRKLSDLLPELGFPRFWRDRVPVLFDHGRDEVVRVGDGPPAHGTGAAAGGGDHLIITLEPSEGA